MRSFVWVLPLILLVLVVIAAYFLGLAQDKASKAAFNSTRYVDKEKSSGKINIDKPDGVKNTITNSSQSIIK
jgi:hypothetical protein